MQIQNDTILQRRQVLPTNRALQPKPHPILQTLTMEDVSARRNHIQSSSQHTRHARCALHARSHDRHLQNLHANRAIRHVQVAIFLLADHELFLAAGRGPLEGWRCRRLHEADWETACFDVVFVEDGVVVMSFIVPGLWESVSWAEDLLGY